MDARFWDLFWTTGMPEAWLMSRGGEGPDVPGPELGLGQGLPGTLSDAPYPPVGSIPGNPNNLY